MDFSRFESPTKAVLHDLAKLTLNGTDPPLSCSKLRKLRPPTVAVGGQSTLVEVFRPPWSRARVVATFSVEPGGY